MFRGGLRFGISWVDIRVVTLVRCGTRDMCIMLKFTWVCLFYLSRNCFTEIESLMSCNEPTISYACCLRVV